MQLENKVALITGAGSGIAKAASLLFAKEGAKVAALGRTKDELTQTVKEIESNGGKAIPLVADISHEDEMQQVISHLINEWGRLDVVFANAGINGVWAPLEELTPEDWDRTININLRGTFLTVKYAVPHLKEQGGSVIVTASVNGTRNFSNSGATAYACSKAAQVAFVKMVALELAEDKVRVNAICPGAIATDIGENTDHQNIEHLKPPVEFPEGKIPINEGKAGSPEQVAQLALFLASDAASHITGTPIWIDGAESLLKG